jgi:uncharacterized protein YwgA
MNPSQFVLSLIRAFGGEISGRTLLQKRAYFVSMLSGLPLDLGYQAHYYGPYSATLDGTLTQMKNLGFVEEGSTGFGTSGGFEMRRYDYSLTEDGDRVLQRFAEDREYQAIEAAAKKIQNAGNPDYVELSIAAKAFYILQKQKKPMTAAELLKEATKFNWNIPEHSLKGAIRFLTSVGLTKG